MAMRHFDDSMINTYESVYGGMVKSGMEFEQYAAMFNSCIQWFRTVLKKYSFMMNDDKADEALLTFFYAVYDDLHRAPTSLEAYFLSYLMKKSFRDGNDLKMAMERSNTNTNYDLFRRYLREPEYGIGLIDLACGMFVLNGDGSMSEAEKEALRPMLRYNQLGM